MTTNEMTEKKTANSPQDRLASLICGLLEPMGYELVHMEVHTHRQKTLRLFIDHLDSSPSGTGITLDDCVAVTHALDAPLDQSAEVEEVFRGSYELEVSSPGVDRPLRHERDYERFSGRQARIHVFRPLTAEEIGNPAFQTKHPKQKNFLGTLKGMRDGKVVLNLVPDESGKKPGAKKSKAAEAAGVEVNIPLPLISKANLEPRFEFEAD